MLIKTEARNRVAVGLQRHESVHGRPQAVAADRQNNFVQTAGIIAHQIHQRLVFPTYQLGGILVTR